MKKCRINVFRSTRPWQIIDKGESTTSQKESIKEDAEKAHQLFEWMITEGNLNIEDDVFARGLKAICQLLIESQ